MSVRTTIQEEAAGLQEYINKMAPADDLLSECLTQLKPMMEEAPEEQSWKDKPVHGMHRRQTEEVADTGKPYQRLEKTGLEDSPEALIMAAQEQALNTRSIEVEADHTRQDQTVQHITAGCKMLAGKASTERHNQVAER